MTDEVEAGGYKARVLTQAGMVRVVGTFERMAYSWEVLRGGAVADSGCDYMPSGRPSAAELLYIWAYGENSAVTHSERDEIAAANAVYDDDGVIIAEFEVV